MDTRQRSRPRAAARRIGVGLAAAVLVGVPVFGAMRPARADSGPCGTGTLTSSGTRTTCTYSYTGGEQTFSVPAGVTALDVVAIGGKGGAGADGGAAGGYGAAVTATIPLPSGTSRLYVEVGGNGTDGGGIDIGGNIYPVGGDGGYNGGGSDPGGFVPGGGGGGASDVRTVPVSESATLDSRLVVAGGGGGGGAWSGTGSGGNAGNADGSGEAGATADSSQTFNGDAGAGGGGATASAPGAGGNSTTTDNPGQDGSLGQGGSGGSNAEVPGDGGSGGGGYYGGGGGGAPGGGGGAGSSYALAGATNVSFAHDTTGTPKIVISFTTPSTQPTTTPTPELGSGELLAVGLLPLGLAFLARRRRARRTA